jgi:hypothetical protein
MNDRSSALLRDTARIVQERMEPALVEALADLASGLKQGITEKLNLAVRRLRFSGNGLTWSDALVEATQGFCDRAAVFGVEDGALRVLAARNVDGIAPVDAAPLDSAPAFAAAVESSDTVVAVRTGGEMSERLAAYLGEAETSKFCLFPISKRERAVAVLYADADGRSVDSNALELLASVAGAILESRPATTAATSDLVSIAAVNGTPDDQELHSRARRFARVQVAEMRLFHSESVKNGRAGRNLYPSLQTEIDSAREAFRHDFLNASETMVDYLHLELVRTLANDEVELLGPEYPGPLV